MRTKTNIYITVIIFLCLIISCKTKQLQSNGHIVGYEKFNSKTIVYIDNMQREHIPIVLKEFYYNTLTDSDFLKPIIEISQLDSSRSVILVSKRAKSGYMYINQFSNSFVGKYLNIFYTINNDTINSKEKVIQLIILERNEIISIDTCKSGKFNEIRIKKKK